MVKKNTTKALIFAAGLGTRLRPFTDHHPKALFLVEGKPLLAHSIDHLIKYGITDVIINVHHFSEQIIDHLLKNHNYGINISISDESEELLDTGGGLKKAAWYFDNNNPFLVRNVDVLSDLDLKLLLDLHTGKNGLATLAVKERETSRYLLFNEEMKLCGWENKKTGEIKTSRENKSVSRHLAFSGIQVLDPKIFDLITETGKFSLTEMYLRLSKDQDIYGYLDRESFWKDAGK